MKQKFLFLTLLAFLFSSCSVDEDEEIQISEPELSDHQLAVIDYFQEIALGFEFGNASSITRKWNSDMKIFVGGTKHPYLLEELEKVTTEINHLATDGFSVEIVDDSLQSNYYLFFGTGEAYAQLYPSQASYVDSNWGLFNIWWNSNNYLNTGNMYVDIERPTQNEQKHLLREELTQSLGLAKDSPLYQESIFQTEWTSTREFSTIDKELIRLLYHPEMSVGLNANQVETRLKEIFLEE